MPRVEDEEIQRLHIQLYSEDVKILNDIYGDSIGLSRAVRRIVRAFIEENKDEIVEGLMP